MIFKHIHPEYKHLEDKLIDCIENFQSKGDVVLKGERNEIKSFIVNGEKVIIKSFKKPNIINSFIYKYIRKSKAKRSFQYAEFLVDNDILTPFPIGYFEYSSFFGLKSSFYLSRIVDYDFDFRLLIHKPLFEDRENILEQFTRYTYKLHECNINFLDHSPGNTIIVKKDNQQYDFYLIDLNRMKFKKMDFNKRMANFRRLWPSKTMIKIMSKEYAKLYNKTYQETYDLMLKHCRAFQIKVNSKKIRRRKRLIK